MLAPLSFSLSQTDEIEILTENLQDALLKKDITGYAGHFSPDIRQKEKSFIQERTELYSLEMLSFSNRNVKMTGDTADFFIRTVFRNDFSVLFETWILHLSKASGRWMITNKEISPNSRKMFDIKIPSDRYERVKSIEIEQEDIHLRFDNAILFYDNIPDIETALLVVGEGQVHFSPSHPREKHILQLLYKKTYIEDIVEYAFLRFSQSFFEHNVRITKYPETSPPVDMTRERNKAYSLFTKHYPRSFTVENSITGDVLSVLPQDDQTMIEFKGKKIGIHSYIYHPDSKEKVNFYEWENDRIISLYSPLTPDKQKQMVLSTSNEYDIEHYQTEVDFDPATSYLAAKVKIRLFSRLHDLQLARFRINPDLSILRVLDGKKQDLFYTQDKIRNSLYVYFNEPLKLDEPEELELFYRGKILPTEHIGEIYYYQKYGEEIMEIPFNQDTYYFGQTSYWYPEPYFDDYFTAVMKIIIPPEFTAIANGTPTGKSTLNGMEEVDHIDDIGNSVYGFNTEKPLKSLSFIIGPLKLVERKESYLPVQVMKASSVTASRERLIQEIETIIRFYSEKFGAYPFDHLSVVRRLWTTRGGLSAASFLVLQEIPRTFHRYDRKIQSEISPVDLSRWEGFFLAHELAHQWWGHGVTWKTYRDLWISEGLAQYASILYLIDKFGESAALDIKQRFSRQTRRFSHWGPISLGTRISHYNYEAFQTIIYNKTALVFDMLRILVGDKNFFEGLQTFFTRFKYQAATKNDFIGVMEEVSEKELSQFFKSWFDVYTLPQVEVTHSIHEENGSFALKLRLVQTRGNFVFPLLVEWTEDGIIQKKRLVVDDKTEEFTLRRQAKPKKIRINPDNAVPGKFIH
jgi:hypothetical protein